MKQFYSKSEKVESPLAVIYVSTLTNGLRTLKGYMSLK